MKAIWNGKVIAESNNTKVIEGNHYFPHDFIKKEFFKPSDTKTTCHWKGEASYYSVEVDGSVNEDAAWFYPEISSMAKSIENAVAFWKGLEVTP